MSKKLLSILLTAVMLFAVLLNGGAMLETYAAGKTATITKQPVSATVSNGATVAVNLTATGDGLTYKWYFKDRGAAGFSLTTTFKSNSYSAQMNTARHGRQVYCVVTDKYGNSQRTNTVTLGMTGALKLIEQPRSVTAPNGKEAATAVTATGSGLTYKWYYKNKGASSFAYTSSYAGDTYSAKMNSTRNGRQVYCVITDKYGISVKTNTVTLKMGNPLTVKNDLKDISVPRGYRSRMTIQATGDGLTYKWYFKNADMNAFMVTDTFKGATYSVDMDETRHGRQVYCVVSDKYGNSFRTATCTISIADAATIVTQPSSVTVKKDATATVSVKAIGEGLTYKWFFKENGESVFRQTNTFKGATYSVAMTPARHGRQVYCVVSDKYGNTFRTVTATLNMKGGVKITSNLSSATVANGKTAVVSLKATGDGLTYKWYFRNKGVSGYGLTTTFKGNSYSAQMNTTRHGRQVYCVVTDKYGNSVKSATATLRMSGAVKITGQPQSVAAPQGKDAVVSVTATGNGLNYKWYYKNKGAAKFTYTSSVRGNVYAAPMNASRSGRQVYCVITDKYGNQERTNTVTLTMGTPLVLTKQPQSAAVPRDGSVAITVGATGKGLTYKWYYKNVGDTAFTYTSTFKSNYYTTTMRDDRNGREVYCVITDQYGNSVKTNTAVMTVAKVTVTQYITVDMGTGDPLLFGVGKDGKYTLPTPTRLGYSFQEFQKEDGSSFPLSGTISGPLSIKAIWKAEGTTTQKDLIERAAQGRKDILITKNIVIDQPIYIAHDVRIFADGNYSIKRAPWYTGDMFVVGTDKNGTPAVLNHRQAILTLGGGEGTLTIDGNKANTTATVVGAAVYVTDSGVLNMEDGARIANNKKLGNKRILTNTDLVSVDALKLAGGAAIQVFNGTVNMNGGIIENNEVSLSTTTFEGAFGGAVYNRGSFNMTGGIIRNNKASRGGAIYNDEIIMLQSGTLDSNEATGYGGAIIGSGGSTAQIFLGHTGSGDKLIINGNRSAKAGGAISSNVCNPIVISGNTVFTNNYTDSIGGAIYTGGTLTVRDTVFEGNQSAVSGGAIYFNYSDVKRERRDMEVTDSVFRNNTAVYGGAITTGAYENEKNLGVRVAITDTLFEGNTAINADASAGNGGAIYATTNTEMTLANCSFTNNEAASIGGGVYVHSGSKVRLHTPYFEGNKAVYGGALNYYSGEMVLVGGTFKNNTADYGGAIFSHPTTFNLNDAVFEGNTATSNGGAMYLQGAKVTASSTVQFKDNTSKNGGAVYVTSSGENLGSFTVNGSTFDGNTATAAGGAVAVRANCTGVFKNAVFTGNQSTDPNTGYDKNIGGGAVFGKDAIITMTGVTMQDNDSANYGGAVMMNGGNFLLNGQSSIADSDASTGAAVYLLNCASMDLRDTAISGCTTKWNGAVYVSGTKLDITGVTATGNQAEKGGVFYLSAGTIQLKDVTATGNTGKYGGVLYTGAATVTAIDCTFNENTGTYGGVAHVEGGSVTFQNLTANRNKASNGGVLNVIGTGKVMVNGATMEQNEAASSGGAIYALPVELQVSNIKFHGNKAGYGGAIALNGTDFILDAQSEFKNNTASVRGGAIDATLYEGAPSKLTVPAILFEGNTAPTGGAVYLRTNGEATFEGTTFKNNQSTDANAANSKDIGGGAVYAYSGVKLTLKDAVLEGNTSKNYGGAVMAYGAGTITVSGTKVTGSTGNTGTALYFNGCTTMNVSDTEVSGNTAKWNGAIYTNAGTFTATNLTGKDNQADKGAVLYVSGGTANVTGLTASGNSAKNGGVMHVGGGEATVTDGNFTNNSATQNGGVFNVEGGKLIVLNGEAKKNTATLDGGVFHQAGGTVEVTGMTIQENTAKYGGAFNIASGTATLNGGTVNQNTGTYGGALSVKGGTLNTNNVEITENSATNGAAANVIGGKLSAVGGKLSNNTAGSGASGGAIYATVATVELKDIEINQNTAGYGGALALNGTTVTVSGATQMKNNIGIVRGGAIDLTRDGTTYGNLTMTDGLFEGNESPIGGAVAIRGLSSATFTGTTFKQNQSTDSNASNDKTIGGGAVFVNADCFLTMTDATLEGNTSKNYGGGVMVNGATVTLSGTKVTGSTGNTGAALYFYSCKQMTLTDCDVRENVAKWNGAIYTNAGTLTVNDLDAVKNTADKGAVLYVSGGTVNVTDLSATDNAASRGGVVHVGAGTVTLTGSTLTGNIASSGGAAYVEGGTLEWKATTVFQNVATNGGAANVVGGKLILDGATVTENTSGEGASGGAIYAIAPGVVEIKDSRVNDNKAGYGGALSLNGVTATITTSEFKNNIGTVRGGAIDLSVSGSALGNLTMTDGLFEGNTCKTGGAVAVRGASTANFEGTTFKANASNDANAGNDRAIGGGALYVHADTYVNLKGVILDGNHSAKYGGGILSNAGRLTISDITEFKNNTAATHGAAMYLYGGKATVTDTKLTDNEATWKGVVFIGNNPTVTFENITATGNKADEGGVISLADQPTVTITRMTATGNSAKSNGGVIHHLGWGGKLDIVNCNFTGNSAVKNGGALWAGAKAPVTVNGGSFKENTAKTGGAFYVDTGLVGGNPSPANVTVKGGALFEANRAIGGDGGAIVLADTTTAGTYATTLTLNNVTFHENKSYGLGGAVATDGNSTGLVLKATDCTFTGNVTAVDNTSATPGGGAIAIQNGNNAANGDPTALNIVLTNCLFMDNKGKGTGGAIDVRSASYLKIDGITATGNKSTAGWNGAVIYVTSENSRLYLTGTVTESDNTAGKYDSFAYISNAKCQVFTTHSSTASWVAKTYSAPAIQFDQTTMP